MCLSFNCILTFFTEVSFPASIAIAVCLSASASTRPSVLALAINGKIWATWIWKVNMFQLLLKKKLAEKLSFPDEIMQRVQMSILVYFSGLCENPWFFSKISLKIAYSFHSYTQIYHLLYILWDWDHMDQRTVEELIISRNLGWNSFTMLWIKEIE